MTPDDNNSRLLGDNRSMQNRNQDRIDKQKFDINKVRAETVLESVRGTLKIIHQFLELKTIHDDAEAKAFVMRERGDLILKEMQVYREKNELERGERLEMWELTSNILRDLKTALRECRQNETTEQLLIGLYTEIIRKLK